MKKTVRILSLAAVIILGLSLLALLVCIFAQVPLVSSAYGMDKATVKENFAFPLGAFFGTLDYCIVAVLLLITAEKGSKGIWAELLCIGLIVLVCPVITSVLSKAQMILLSRVRGANAQGVYSMVSSICTTSQSLRGVAVGSCLVSCGMRIAMKRQN